MEQEKVQLKRFLMGYDLLKIYEINHTKNIKLGLGHLAIIDWFTCFQGTNKMEYKIIDGEIWYWCSYAKIISDLPILGITDKSALAKLVKALADAEIFNYFFDKKGGSKTYIKLGAKYNDLVSGEKNEITFDVNSYKHKVKKGLGKKTLRVKLKSIKGLGKKTQPRSVKKPNNRLVNYRLVKIDKIIIKHKATFKRFTIKKINNNSFDENLKKINNLLLEKSLDKSTCKNILKAVKEHSFTFDKVNSIFEYAKSKGKENEIGYIVKAFQENWNTSIATKPVTKKSDSIEKENQFIKKRELEKEEASKQLLPDVELTPELEEQLRQKVMIAENIKLPVLDSMKVKSKKMYISVLKKYLTA